MNTELLQQILTMVGAAGEGAFALAIVYLIVPVIESAIVATIIAWAISKIVRLIQSFSAYVYVINHFAAKLRYSFYGDLSNREAQELIELIEKRMQ